MNFIGRTLRATHDYEDKKGFSKHLAPKTLSKHKKKADKEKQKAEKK